MVAIVHEWKRYPTKFLFPDDQIERLARRGLIGLTAQANSGTGMSILKPRDWETITQDCIDVIIAMPDMNRAWCGIWLKDEFLARGPRVSSLLKRAIPTVITSNLGFASFRGLNAWGPCIIGMISDDTGDLICAVGVLLHVSPNTQWLTEVPAKAVERAARSVRFPLRETSFPLSDFPTNQTTNVKTVGDISELFRENDSDFAGIKVFHAVTSYVIRDLRMDHLFCDPGLCLSDNFKVSGYTSSNIYFARFEACDVRIPDGYLIDKFGVWSDSSLSSFINKNHLLENPDMTRVDGEILYCPTAVRSIDNWNESSQHDGTFALTLISNLFFSNHAHWLLNCLFPAFLIKSQIKAGRTKLLCPLLNGYKRDSLFSVGIESGDIIEAAPGTYAIDRLIFPSTLSTKCNYFPTPVLREMFLAIQQSVALHTSRKGPEKIYITRIGSGALRTISNELVLMEALKERGFLTIAPHELSFQDEVRCFSNARIVVGQLGAGLANIGLLQLVAKFSN